MDTLRRHIGGHEGAAPGQLCVTELGSLILRAGRAAGLIVRAEIQVVGHTGTREVVGEMDYGWYCPTTRNWLVAWELDGRDVGEAHIAGKAERLGNAKKFIACTATMKVQVLHSLRNSLKPWGRSQADRCRRLLGSGVRVVSDEELIAPLGIEGYIKEARRLAGMKELP